MLTHTPGQRRTVFCRGLSLFGALLALALLGMTVLVASTFFETLAAERRARIAVQQLTVLADASASHVHGRFPELLAAARSGPVEITLAQLKGAGSLPADFSAVDALGRAAGAGAVDVLATEAVEPGDTVAPSAALLEAAGEARLGLVAPGTPSRLAGPTLDYGVSAFQAAFGGAPAVGALAALRRFDHQAVYGGRLQRLAVPGFPDANRMETDLDMGGNAITGAGRLSAASLALSGDLEAGGDIAVSGDLTVGQAVRVAGNAGKHFYESARAIVAGYMAWVRFQEPAERQNLSTLYEMLSMPPKERDEFAEGVASMDRFAGGLTHIAVERQAQVGDEEGGSNFMTIANQLAFLNYPELLAHTQTPSFDPLILAEGDTDLFVVAPEETIEHVKGWLRLWVAIPNAVAGIKPLERDLLIVIDEMPRLGYLKPVMDGYTMAAGKGVHFWCFAQSISALDSTWGKEHRKTLLHLAELVQILGFPRTDAEGAEELSKAIGTATFEARTENRSGTIAENRIVTANTQWQAGDSRTLVRERLITPDELMTLGPDRQYIIASPKDMPRDALHLHHTRYWRRWDSRDLADPNPFVIRKERAEKANAKRVWPQFKLPFGGKTL